MSRYLKASQRVLIVVLAAAAVGLSLFAFMQLVVHPLIGPPRRARFVEGTRPPALQEGREGPREQEGGEGGLPRRIRPRALLRLALDALPFFAAAAIVIFVQRVFFKKPPKIPGGPGVRAE